MKTSRLTTANWVRISLRKLLLRGDLEATAGSQRTIVVTPFVSFCFYVNHQRAQQKKKKRHKAVDKTPVFPFF